MNELGYQDMKADKISNFIGAVKQATVRKEILMTYRRFSLQPMGLYKLLVRILPDKAMLKFARATR